MTSAGSTKTARRCAPSPEINTGGTLEVMSIGGVEVLNLAATDTDLKGFIGGFTDGTHGGEVTYLRMFLAINRLDPAVFDGKFAGMLFYSILENVADIFSIFCRKFTDYA